MKKIYSIHFKNNANVIYAQSEEDFMLEDEVIVQNEKGLEYGKIGAIKNNLNPDTKVFEIIRRASEEDKNTFYKNLKDSQSACEKTKFLVKELKINMNVINANFNFERTQLLINFSSDERVDFRELARKLAGIYRTRIELRQIGVRDKAKNIGGIGVCGQELCCGRFLNSIDSISMSKAKNQNLALNPSKINGACGRLLCCLCYEDEEYTRCQKGLLSVGSKIRYQGKDGIIVGVDILSRTYKVLIDDQKISIKAEEINNGSKK